MVGETWTQCKKLLDELSSEQPIRVSFVPILDVHHSFGGVLLDVHHLFGELTSEDNPIIKIMFL